MVVVDGVDRTRRYYNANRERIAEDGLTFRALVAFSGSRTVEGLYGQEVSEAQMNGFPEGKTAYRTEKQSSVRITLEYEDAEIDPIQAQRGGGLTDALDTFGRFSALT